MPRVTDIRNCVITELKTLVPNQAEAVVASLDERAQYSSRLPMLRVSRGDSEIEADNLSEWQHSMTLSVTYVDYLEENTDDRVDAAIEAIVTLVTRSDSLDEYVDFVEPDSINFDDVESDDPLIAAQINFNIQYSEDA